MPDLKMKTAIITGASRGIGKAIALRLAKAGANIVILAKTDKPHPILEGTIYSTAEEVEKLGAKALPLAVDIRDEAAVYRAVEEGAKRFGGIDILVNNASAILLASTHQLPMKRFDLMHQVNVRGTFMCSQACYPYLRRSTNPHILTISPPLQMGPNRWYKEHLGYTMSKYGMSMCVMGMAEEFREEGVAVNALWPFTTIDTAALSVLKDDQLRLRSRTPEIMADAAYAILTKPSRSCTGNFFIDEEVLRREGKTSFENYAVSPGSPLQRDLFV